ncbi:MAG: DUF1439 domain-containing protein [Pseudoxanthomonas suwonensis]|nr:DUF1439 domain-containing protein [Pseudoxanthomonas suwonensis]
MNRQSRNVLSLVLLLSLLLGACATVGALLGDQVTFTALQLQQQLDRRFPRDYTKLGGLVGVRVFNPRLSIPAGRGRLQLDFDVGVARAGGQVDTPAGRFAVSSGLRFDAAKRGLMLDAPSLERIDVPGLGGGSSDAARELINLWLADWAREEPVYRFDDGLMQTLAARRIGSTSIGNGLVTLHLDQ